MHSIETTDILKYTSISYIQLIKMFFLNMNLTV